MRESAHRREAHLWGEAGAVVSTCMRESAQRAEAHREDRVAQPKRYRGREGEQPRRMHPSKCL